MPCTADISEHFGEFVDDMRGKPSWEVVVVGMIVVWAQGVSGSVVPVSVWAWREGQI